MQLRQRVLSAIVMLPPVLVTAWLGGWWFAGLVALLAGLAVWELTALLAKTDHSPLPHLAVPLAVLLVLEGQLPPDPRRLQIFLVVAILIGLTIMLFRPTPRPGNDWLLTLGAGLYLGMSLRFLPLLRGLEAGLGWLAVTALTTWVADSGAYFIGSRFGAHKLWPRISPKKSWEGLFGGLAVGLVAALLLGPRLIPGLLWWQGLLIGLVVGVSGLFGDLSESVFKRQVGEKDSSHLIPGHGGFFDRIDSFLFVGPCLYLLALLLGW